MIGDTNYLSFPGLGIGEIKINEIAFSIFGKNVMWYGIIITLGILGGFLYALRRSKDEGLTHDDVLDYAIYCVIAAIIGARLYYVFTKFDTFKGDSLKETLYNIVAVWNGGLAIYGAVIAGGITVFIVSKVKKINPYKALDMIAPGVMIGQIIGRWGNFCNAEAFGSFTNLPWRMGIRNSDFPVTIYVHPTFLYESLWNLIGFLIINAFYKKKKFDGQIILMYLTWYGLGRAFIEGLRTDSLYVGPFRISQLVGIFCFIVGTVLLITLCIHFSKRKVIVDQNNEEITVSAEKIEECDTAVSEKEEIIREADNDKSKE